MASTTLSPKVKKGNTLRRAPLDVYDARGDDDVVRKIMTAASTNTQQTFSHRGVMTILEQLKNTEQYKLNIKKFV